ncbi:iron complex transport system permease protein [Dietzia sp. 2505]|uniref:FecCD family ABC transporter permease n=1 Tax=Dietzia sp. 2505 TaxID=3156457 RepID=UPI003394159D
MTRDTPLRAHRAVGAEYGGSPVPRPSGRTGLLVLGLVGASGVLVLTSVMSVFVGSVSLTPGEVMAALTHPTDLIAYTTVVEMRMPRTLLGILVGAALGASGALAQALTRNPLADPGILGVNAGAALAVAIAIAFFGVTTIHGYVWFAFAGAFAAFVLVYAIALRGPHGATPVRLTLVGVALTAVFTGSGQSLALVMPRVFDQMRFWGVGTLSDRPHGTVEFVLPFILVGLVVALLTGRATNAIALGDERARSMGVPVGLVRAVSALAITVLCGAATAAAGPIAFVGLMVPHAVRLFTGPDQRWVLAFSVVLAPVLLIAADIAGRLVVWPAELQAGVVTAFLGAPVLILLVRRAERGGV